MKYKLKVFMFVLFLIFFVFGGKVSVEIVNIVFDIVYVLFEFKDFD